MARKPQAPAPADAGDVDIKVWYPRYPGDYGKKTSMLRALHHGVYTLLLDAYWSHGGPLPDDDEDLHTIARCTVEEWAVCRVKVLQRFFRLKDGHWHNKRMDEELAIARAFRQKAVARAQKGAAARWAGKGGDVPAGSPGQPSGDASSNAPSNALSIPSSNARAVLEQCPSPSPSPSPSQDPSGPSSVAKATAAPAEPASTPPPPAASPPLKAKPPATQKPRASSRQAVGTPGGMLPIDPPRIVSGAMEFSDEDHRKRWLWREAKFLAEELDAVPIKRSGGILAQLHGKYPGVFLDALEIACNPDSSRPALGFVDYLTATCQHLVGERAMSTSKQATLEAGIDAAAAEYLARKGKAPLATTQKGEVIDA